MDAGVLARATLRQADCHVGARDAVARTVRDKRWQRGWDCLGTEQSPSSQSTLWHCRMRLIAHALDTVLLERTVALAEQTGGCGARQLRVALDSTPRWGAGRVEATLTLLGHARRRRGARRPRPSGKPPGWSWGARGVAKRLWTAREHALGLGREAVERWKPWLAQPQSRAAYEPSMQEGLDTIAQVVTQATEPAPEGGPEGRRLKQHVAPERRSALEAPDMRHGRKSSATTCKGCKAHLVWDLDSHVTRAVVVRPANEPEHAVVEMGAEALESGRGLWPRDVDLGSMASPQMARWAAPGVYMSARPWPHSGVLCTQEACSLACTRGAVTCPNGHTVPLVPGTPAQFPASACDPCALRPPCPTASPGHGRSLTLREDEPFQAQRRAKSHTKRGRAARRKRTAVEHAIAPPLAHHGWRARYKGLRKNSGDGRRHAAVSTLQVALHYEDEYRLAS